MLLEKVETRLERVERAFPLLGIVLAALALTAAPASAEAPPGFYASKPLAPAADMVAGKPVTVWCAKSLDEWRASIAGRGFTDPLGFVARPGIRRR
jgi:hypothetical protein